MTHANTARHKVPNHALNAAIWTMECEQDERDSDQNLQADWRLVCACLSYKGELRNHTDNATRMTAWTMADGFGPGLTVDYITRNLEWDWSHIRDSSNAAARRIATFLRSRLPFRLTKPYARA